MKKAIMIMSSLVLSGGVALADGARGGRVQPPPSVQHDSRGGAASSWSGGVAVTHGGPAAHNNGARTFTPRYEGNHASTHSANQPMHAQPQHQPNLIAENHSARPGYTWIAGAWQWNGYEWIWQAGHYEPNASHHYNGY